MGEVVGKAQLAHEHGEDRVEAEDRVGEARVVLHGGLSIVFFLVMRIIPAHLAPHPVSRSLLLLGGKTTLFNPPPHILSRHQYRSEFD